MATIEKQYTGELHKEFGYFAAWDPGIKYKLGDYGKIKHKTVFERYGNISDLGIKFRTTDPSPSGKLSYQSKGTTKSIIKIGGAIDDPALSTGKVTAEIDFNFENEKSTILEAIGVREYGISSIDDLRKELEILRAKKEWDDEYAVIVSIKIADSETVLVTNQGGASIRLKTDIDMKALPSDPTTLNIADASLNWEITNENNCSYKYLAKGELTPLFKLGKFERKRPFTKRRLVYRKGIGARKSNVNKHKIVFKEVEVIP